MPETWMTDEMRAIIGREYGTRTSYPISISDIRKWALAVYYPEPPPRLYWDEAYVAEAGIESIVAPEEFNPFGWITTEGPPPAPGEDGREPHIGPEWIFGVESPATSDRLNGGLDATYSGVRMRPGDVVSSVTRLAEYSERSGRLGLMLFTVTEQRWTNQEGQELKVQRDILIRY